MSIAALFCFLANFAAATPVRPHSHITTPAQTLRAGRVSFENFPGANSNVPFLLNSLTYGLTRRLQVGTVPMFYVALPSHRYNANAKWGVWESEQMDVGLGASLFSFRFSDQPNTAPANIDLVFAFVALNYRFPDERFSLGVNLAAANAWSTNAAIQRIVNSRLHRRPEWAIDTSVRLNESWTTIFGFGANALEVFEIRSPYAFGFGASMAYDDPPVVSRVRVGIHYYPEPKVLKALATVDL